VLQLHIRSTDTGNKPANIAINIGAASTEVWVSCYICLTQGQTEMLVLGCLAYNMSFVIFQYAPDACQLSSATVIQGACKPLLLGALPPSTVMAPADGWTSYSIDLNLYAPAEVRAKSQLPASLACMQC
jgi:hypothetical protein